METNQTERRKMVTIPHDDFEQMLERAAERGARHALHEVGLDGEDAAHDIRELRKSARCLQSRPRRLRA
jgi:hypothetical protein